VCIIVILCVFGVLCVCIALVLQPETRTPLQPNHAKYPQHRTNREQNDRCGNSTAQSQAPDDGCINVRNMLST